MKSYNDSLSVQDLDQNENRINYLVHQYPWFNRDEIVEALERFTYRMERVVPYLDMKSGCWTFAEVTEF